MPTRLDVHGLVVEMATPSGWTRPVNEVSFELEAGTTLGLVGESGSGKTMLSLALMGLLPPGARSSGQAWLDTDGTRTDLLTLREDEFARVRGCRIAMIFQEPMTALNPVLRIGAQIEEAIRAHQPRLTAVERRRRTLAALARAAVAEPELRARQYPHQLSGGLRQRATIAMALAADPRFLIADEPTTALDVTVQKQILDLLADLGAELRLGLLFITHDLGIVSRIADRLAVMYAGRLVEEGPTAEVLRHPRHPYTEGLLRASPRLRRTRLVPITGSVPSLDALPPGCAFEPRCPVRRPECSSAVPELRSAGRVHRARCILV